jgi:hypothetical protein
LFFGIANSCHLQHALAVSAVKLNALTGNFARSRIWAMLAPGSFMFIPDTVRFVLVVAALVGAVYGGAYALATYPPEQTEVIKSLPHEKLRQG